MVVLASGFGLVNGGFGLASGFGLVNDGVLERSEGEFGSGVRDEARSEVGSEVKSSSPSPPSPPSSSASSPKALIVIGLGWSKPKKRPKRSQNIFNKIIDALLQQSYEVIYRFDERFRYFVINSLLYL